MEDKKVNVICKCGRTGYDSTYPNREVVEVDECGYCR